MESPNKKPKSGFSRIVRWVAVIIAIILIGLFSISYWGVYERGTMSGKIFRISEKGFIFKTWEGKLDLETFGALKGVSPIAETFDFSVERKNKEVIRKLEEASLKGERVSLQYIKRFNVFFWRGNTKYFVINVVQNE
ncbi:MAG: hypothetical protein A2X22_08935 [Bacteroidetes bacterium GWF2_49_14]|nr:MAG: hypothetical protein A2X22_08935 [Bacteroidetes bacterium GWF2_49_14]HBB91166.1 6-phosphogluconate dehydrogenase [Bacteroidales bacterium]